MHRLLYTSESRLARGGEDGHDTVRDLCRRFSGANAAAGISGALIYVDGQFIQVLEGALDTLENLFERICCDFRHASVRLIDLMPIEERLFRDWGMACLSAGKDTPLNLREELGEVRFLVGVNGREAVDHMRTLLDKHGGARAFGDASGTRKLAEAFGG